MCFVTEFLNQNISSTSIYELNKNQAYDLETREDVDILMTADVINNPTKSVRQTNLPNETVIPQTTITPDTVFDESSKHLRGVKLINKTTSKDLLSADKSEEFASSNLPSVELIEEGDILTVVLFSF